MLKTTILVPFVLLFVLLSSTAQANAWANSSTVKRYYPQTHTYFQLNETMINPAGCASIWYYAIASNNPWQEEFRRVLLTALASGKKVSVAVSSTPGDCLGQYPRVTYMYIDS